MPYTCVHKHKRKGRPGLPDQIVPTGRQGKQAVYSIVEQFISYSPQYQVQCLKQEKDDYAHADQPRDYAALPELIYYIVPN
jgi:hypothetical protein